MRLCCGTEDPALISVELPEGLIISDIVDVNYTLLPEWREKASLPD